MTGKPLAWLFYAAVLLDAFLVVSGPLRATEAELIDLRRLDGIHHEGRAAVADLPRFGPLALSDDASLLEDGALLAQPDASPASVASLGSGRWCIVAKRSVVWSSSDGTDPLANGRRYELVARPNGAFGGWAIAVSMAAAALGLAAWARGELALTGASSTSVRALVIVVTLATLGAGLARGWDRILVGPEAPAVFVPSPVRAPLYPSFVEALDAKHGEPRTAIAADEGATPRRDGGHRFIHVVQAQKVLTVLAIVALIFELTCGLNAWLVAAVTYLGVLADLLRAGPGSVHFDVNVVGTEGLDHALALFFLAVTFAYLRNPTGLKGALIALLLTLLVSNRPSNVGLVAVFPILAAHHMGRGETWQRALTTTASLVVVFAFPLAVHVVEGMRATGRVELACTPGSAALPLALQVATPEDARVFEDDPALRDLARALLVENRSKLAVYDEATARRCIEANLRAAIPAFARTVKVPEGRTPEVHAESVFRELSGRLIARHGGDYARLVAVDFALAWQWWLHGPMLVAVGLAVTLYVRTRAYELLYAAAFGALPLVAVVPACAVGLPGATDRAGLGFAEPVAVAMLAVTLWTLGKRAFETAGDVAEDDVAESEALSAP